MRKPSSSAVILWNSQENKDSFHIFSLLHFFLFSCQNCYHLDIMFLSYTIKITLCLLCIALSLWFFLMIIQFIRYNKASIWLMLLGKKKAWVYNAHKFITFKQTYVLLETLSKEYLLSVIFTWICYLSLIVSKKCETLHIINKMWQLV